MTRRRDRLRFSRRWGDSLRGLEAGSGGLIGVHNYARLSPRFPFVFGAGGGVGEVETDTIPRLFLDFRRRVGSAAVAAAALVGAETCTEIYRGRSVAFRRHCALLFTRASLWFGIYRIHRQTRVRAESAAERPQDDSSSKHHHH